MSKPLKLSLTKVTCQAEQFEEPGKDEMYLILFGVTESGRRLLVPPTSLGSYGTGDVNQGTFPKTLIDETVNETENLAAICIWLFERDSGGLAGSEADLASSFNTLMNNHLALDAPMNLQPGALQLYAFAQSMVDIRYTLIADADSFWNSDDLLLPKFQHLIATLPQPGSHGANSFQVQIGADGMYLLNFDLQFRRGLVFES